VLTLPHLTLMSSMANVGSAPPKRVQSSPPWWQLSHPGTAACAESPRTTGMKLWREIGTACIRVTRRDVPEHVPCKRLQVDGNLVLRLLQCEKNVPQQMAAPSGWVTS